MKSQAILKCFVDLKSSVRFMLGSEDETMFCDTTAGQGFQNTKWPAVLYSQQISQNRKILANLNYHMSI